MVYTRSNSFGPKAVAALLSRWLKRFPGHLRRSARLSARLPGCERAAISPMFALMLIPISGSIAFAVELGGMMYIQRSLQNAADAAALAAASNNTGPVADAVGTSALMEARAAAKPYGYVNGTGNVTVTADETACPTGTAAGAVCYEAVVTDVFPLTFSRLVGFSGNQALGSNGRGQLVSARAIATAAGGTAGVPSPACLWALGDSGVTLSGSGIPFADLSGCGVISEGSISCVGNTMEANYALSGSGTSSGCAAVAENDIDPSDENWVELPENPFTSLTPPAKPSGPACGDNPAEQTLSTNQSASLLYYCGNVKLTGNVDLTGSNMVVVIDNGTLDLNGYTLKTSGADASATVIFTGTNTADRQHYPTTSQANQGVLSIRAPTTGTWANIAMFQDPVLTNREYNSGGKKQTINFTYAGNNPTWNISGVVYFPNATTDFRGVVGKYEDNVSCFVLMAYSIAITGTGEFISDNTTEDCETEGYTIPEVTIGGGTTRPKLVF
jgi:hypothetical protein